jgi:hypothetical protein
MGPSLVERAAELRDIVDSLARVRDDAGVLSITVGIEPGAGVGAKPAWEIRLENDLARLSRDVARGRAVERRIAEADVDLSQLLDPAVSGRGRALYLALGSGAATEIFLHHPLPTGARVGQVAHLLPLLEALDDGEPAGFLVASRDAISVSESELGAVREHERLDLEPWIGNWWPEMKAHARANPLRGQQTVSHRDRYARRVAAAYRHTLDQAVEKIASLAPRRGWTRAVIAGDARRTNVLDEALRRAGLGTTVLGATLEGVREEEAVARLRAALAGLVARQALEQAREAEAEATAGGRGACGLAHVLATLAEGRVARLLIDPSRSFPGAVGPDEWMSAAVEAGGGVDLTDWIVARALATDAAITPVHGEAAAVLKGRDGIGALLRW